MVLGAELINNPIRFAVDSEESTVKFEKTSSFQSGMEAKSGKLKLCLSRNQTEQSQQIVLKLYAAVPCAFAVVFPDKFICPKHCGLIQLRNFSVEANGEREFTVMIKNAMEGGRFLRFSANSSEERDSWLNTFQQVAQSCTKKGGNCKKARRNINNRLPSLEEVSEEIEDKEERTVLQSCENVFQDNNNRRKRPLTPRRRVVEAPMLEQISEEEEEYDSEMDIENRINSTSRRRSSLKDCLSEMSRGGRSL